MASERDSSLLLDDIKLLKLLCKNWCRLPVEAGALIAQGVGQADKHVNELNQSQCQPAKD